MFCEELVKYLEKIRAKIGDKTYSKLEDINKLDFKLYLKANKILDEKLKSAENFDEKMLDFKKRCKNLVLFFNS